MDRTWTQDAQGPRFHKMIKTSSIGSHVVEGDQVWGSAFILFSNLNSDISQMWLLLYSQMLIQTFAMCHNPWPQIHFSFHILFLALQHLFSSYFCPNFSFFQSQCGPAIGCTLDTWAPQILWCSINHHLILGAPKYFDVPSITTRHLVQRYVFCLLLNFVSLWAVKSKN